MHRTATLALCGLLLTACGGGKSDDTDGNSVIGDGIRPVVSSAEYACFTDTNGGKYFYFRIKAEDEQGADTIEVLGARVLFKSPGGDPLDWDQDGEPNPDDYLELICAADTDPRRCEGSLLESAISGECSGTNLVFEGWVIDADGNESDHTENFEENGAIAPAG